MLRRFYPLVGTIVLASCAEVPFDKGVDDTPTPAITAPAAPRLPLAIERRSGALVMGRCHDVPNDLCYQDAEGKTQYWIYFGKVYSAEVRERQKRYNIWARGQQSSGILEISRVEAPQPYQYYSPPRRTLTGVAITMPISIRESGRLDEDTIAIPFYHGMYRLLTAAHAFQIDCERDYGHDYDSRNNCERIVDSLSPEVTPSTEELSFSLQAGRPLERRKPSPSAQELQGFDPVFRLRMAALQQAFSKSAQFAHALDAVLESSGMDWQDLIVKGVDPDQLSPERLQAMEDADAALTIALAEVDWTADAYRRSTAQ